MADNNEKAQSQNIKIDEALFYKALGTVLCNVKDWNGGRAQRRRPLAPSTETNNTGQDDGEMRDQTDNSS